MRRKKGLQSVLGLILGVLVAQLLKNHHNGYFQTQVGCRRTNRAQQFRAPFAKNHTIRDSDQSLLFVGVMTAGRYLETRARAVYDTWGSELPGRLAFFSSEESYSADLPLVALPGVDDSYPPQKKSFMMLQYMFEHYGDSFEWFVRADDDVYIRVDRLEGLLRSVDSRKPWFIGQAGRGNSQEFGLLSLDHDENFCMGGPGVILSRETLKRIAPHIKTCLGNLYTTHEDVELGRCVRKYAGIQCTWSYEMQTILYHNQSGGFAFTGELKQKEVHRAITMHPIKQPQHLYRLHAYVKGLTIQSLEQNKVCYHREIAQSLGEIGVRPEDLQNYQLSQGLALFPHDKGHSGYLGDPKILGTRHGLNRYRPKNLEDSLDWELIVSKTLYSYKNFNPRRKVPSPLKEGFDDIIGELMTSINMYSKQRGRVIDFKELIYGYWRFDPLHGADTIVDVLLTYRKYRGHKMTVPVRRHAYLQQTFTGMHIREIEYDSDEECEKSPKSQKKQLFHQFHEKISQIGANLKKLPLFETVKKTGPKDKKIFFILPLAGRFATMVRFMKNYEDVCLRNSENAALIVVLYRSKSEPQDFEESVEYIENVSRKYTMDVRIVRMPGEFSRARALQKGTELCTSGDLMFFVDVDIVFNADSLLRIRLNAMRNRQLYFPIVYSQYDPEVVYGEKFNSETNLFRPSDDFHIDERNGFWRQFGFGIVALYKSDFEKLGGFNTNITGWGLEDVRLYEDVLKNKLKFMRTPDPGLVHVFHSIECDERLDAAQKEMCMGTKISMMGSTYHLEQYVLKHSDILERARKNKQNRPA